MTDAEAVELARAAAAKRNLHFARPMFTCFVGKETTTCFVEGTKQAEYPSVTSPGDKSVVGKWYVVFRREGDEDAICGYFDEFKFWIDDETAAVEWNEPPDPPPLWRRILCRMRDALVEIPLMILALPFFAFFWLAGRIADVVSDRAERKRIARTPDCPRCGERLRTPKAQQCFNCGLDWHGGPMPTRAEAESHPVNRS